MHRWLPPCFPFCTCTCVNQLLCPIPIELPFLKPTCCDTKFSSSCNEGTGNRVLIPPPPSQHPIYAHCCLHTALLLLLVPRERTHGVSWQWQIPLHPITVSVSYEQVSQLDLPCLTSLCAPPPPPSLGTHDTHSKVETSFGPLNNHHCPTRLEEDRIVLSPPLSPATHPATHLSRRRHCLPGEPHNLGPDAVGEPDNGQPGIAGPGH